MLVAPALDIILKLAPKTLMCLGRPEVMLPIDAVRELYPVTKTDDKGRPDVEQLFQLMGIEATFVDPE